MHILINQIASSGYRTGVGCYTVELFRCLQQINQDDEIDSFPCEFVLSGWSKVKEFLSRPAAGRIGDAVGGSGTSIAKEWLCRQTRKLGKQLQDRIFHHCSRRYDLYHEPNFVPMRSDCPVVATIHDLSILRDRNWHPQERQRWFDQQLPTMLRQCVHFITISDFSRRQLIHELAIPPHKVSRTYLGIRSGLRQMPSEQVVPILRSLGLPERYLLYVGTLEPRKNVLNLMRAYCAMPAPLRAAWPLLLVGMRGWNAERVLDFYHRYGRHAGVIHVGYVDDVHLGALYNGARGLVYPSYYVGFGLPPAEMLACGGAVISSTAEALVETVGQQACLVEPDDIDGWRQAMQQLLTDDEYWRSLRCGIQYSRVYSWQQCAAETLAVYHQAHGQSATNDFRPVTEA